MATAAQAFAALRRLTPQEAVDYLRGRDRLTTTYNWSELWQEEHARQFTVSRLASADLLADLQRLITDSVAGDLSRRDYMRDARAALAKAGWWGEREVLDPATGELVRTRFDPARLKLIYDTNTRQAYAAGQWERIEATKKTHPYLRYVTMDDDKVRPAHRAWHNVTLPVDDPFWATHMPPNGWRCRCRVVPVNRRDYERGTTPTEAPMVKTAPEVVMRDWLDRAAGKVRSVPAGVDPGFGYNPGRAGRRLRDLQESVERKTAALPPGLASGLADRLPGALQLAAMDYAVTAWADRAAKQQPFAFGKVLPETAARTEALGVSIAGKTIGLAHDALIHTVKEHGGQSELQRGQLPVTAYDFGMFDKLLGLATFSEADPPVGKDGTRRLNALAVDGGVVYEMVVMVRRRDVVLLTMWKRRARG